jgi:hypothetical protein
MTSLPPWASGPYDLLVHADEHLRKGEDFDRRIALISFDNAIEIAIGVYLSLDPLQRGGRRYNSAEVEKWCAGYHSKLEFLAFELATRKWLWEVDRAQIIWCHNHRNEQYHGAHKGVPERQVLTIVRRAALWIFGTLFEVPDIQEQLERSLAEKMPSAPPTRSPAFDTAIDSVLDRIEIGDQVYSASEALYYVDYQAYRDLGIQLAGEPSNGGSLH